MADRTLREKILRAIHQKGSDGYLSGEELSASLGVSRTAVWKQVELLRQQGYDIQAVPSRGYRLVASPDLLTAEEIRAGLATACIGRRVLCLPEVDSTNLEAHRAGEAGEPEGLVVLAESQTAGRGRLGRRWHSPAGVNLYASVLLRPSLPPHVAPQLTFLSAAATAQAIEETCRLAPTVKWPNDILLGGKKVAGLLNEMSAETEGIHFVVLGIGINVNMADEQFPSDLRHPATSLALEAGHAVSRPALAQSLLARLDALYARFLEEGFPPVRRAWERYFDLIGREVEADLQGRLLAGKVAGIDEDGALLLQTTAGVERILAGDIRVLGEGGRRKM